MTVLDNRAPLTGPTPAPIRVALLGPVRARGSGGSITLRGKTARTVLARLALSAGSVVSVDQLTDALWGDDPPLEPTVSLRSIVSRLRTQLGSETLVTEGPGYRIDTALVEVDLTDVEAVATHPDPSSLDPQQLATSLDLWNGEALADVALTAAFEPERARILELRARLTDSYHEAMLRSGRAAETLADLERDAAAAPLRESTQLLLMRALDDCGRTPDALRAGDVYRRRLIDETGLNPTPNYEAVSQSLLTEDEGPEVGGNDRDAAKPQPCPTAWLPPDTPFVGRQTEMAQLQQLTGANRLVTIIGPGGVGKTRLLTEFLRPSDDQLSDTVNMVDLSEVDRSTSVDTPVATSLGLETSSAGALAAVVERLAPGNSVLVLDNCEHVLASSRFLAKQLLQHVPGLRIITTSRRRLGLPNEALVEVGPLEVPIEAAADSSPVRLFLDRVERASPRLAITEPDLLAAADICRLLDGLPLALEVAAARVPMFGFDGLRQRLLDGLTVPSANIADDDRRQATIESTVEWSLALLEPQARSLFDDLTVFPSWFDLSALQQVSQVENVVEHFSTIVDSSLVIIDQQRPAYRLLEPIRQVANRQLNDEHRTHITDRYLDWAAGLLQQVNDQWPDSSNHGDLSVRHRRRADAQKVVVKHRHDLQRALIHLADRQDAERHGHFANILARALIERTDNELSELCRVDVGPSVEGGLARCVLAWHHGDPETSIAIAERLEATIDEASPFWPHLHWAVAPAHLYLGDLNAVARSARIAAAGLSGYSSMRSASIAVWALAALYQGRLDLAKAVLADHEAIVERSTSGGFVVFVRAEIEAVTDPEAAMHLLDQAAKDAASTESTFVARIVEVSQLSLLTRLGRTQDAVELASRLLPRLLRAGILPQAWLALRHLADLLGQQDEPELAILILDSADADGAAAAFGGEAVRAEASRRAGLVDHVARRSHEALEPMSAAGVWDLVEPVLRRGSEPLRASCSAGPAVG